ADAGGDLGGVWRVEAPSDTSRRELTFDRPCRGEARDMRSGSPLRRTAAVVVLAVGAIHGFLAPEYFGEQLYIGALFVAAAVVSAFAAVRLWFVGGRLAWAVGGAGKDAGRARAADPVVA